MTIAAVGTALLLIPPEYAPAEREKLATIVAATVQEWDQTLLPALSDFIERVASQKRDDIREIADVVGAWVLRNLTLEANEQSAPHVVGVAIVNTFVLWWNQ